MSKKKMSYNESVERRKKIRKIIMPLKLIREFEKGRYCINLYNPICIVYAIIVFILAHIYVMFTMDTLGDVYQDFWSCIKLHYIKPFIKRKTK